MVVETLINFYYGSSMEVKVFFRNWSRFTLQVKNVILHTHSILTYSTDPTVEKTFVGTCELLLSISHRNSRAGTDFDIALLSKLDCDKI